jgi:hypothetical protein
MFIQALNHAFESHIFCLTEIFNALPAAFTTRGAAFYHFFNFLHTSNFHLHRLAPMGW